MAVFCRFEGRVYLKLIGKLIGFNISADFFAFCVFDLVVLTVIILFKMLVDGD